MNSYVLSAIILSALITFLLKAFPFLLFKEKELPKMVRKTRKAFTNDYYGSSYCLLSKRFKNAINNSFYSLSFSVFNCRVYL